MDKENNFSIVICSAEIFSIVRILENRKERERLIILLILHVSSNDNENINCMIVNESRKKCTGILRF